MLSLLLFSRVLRCRPLQLSQLLRSPDQGYILLVVQSVDCTGPVTAHAIFVVPKRTFFAVQAESIMRKEIRVLRNRVEVRVDRFVQLLKSIVARTRIGHDRAGFELYSSMFSLLARRCIVAVGTRGAVAYIADVCRRIPRL